MIEVCKWMNVFPKWDMKKSEELKKYLFARESAVKLEQLTMYLIFF